ncbi:MAG: hypothetical protein C0625_01830 [Arcobacter sp.]|nr:MAG: hypothetical protein C0625_01830 [Arcobacter sp.]
MKKKDVNNIEYFMKQRDSYIKEARERENRLLFEEKVEQEEQRIKIEEEKKLQIKKEKLNLSIVSNFVINKNADNRLYYFRFIFKGQTFYKIGITSQTLKNRYSSEYSKIDKVLYDEKIDEAIKVEKDLKKRFKADIFPLAYLNGGGHTETFDRDILGLDN